MLIVLHGVWFAYMLTWQSWAAPLCEREGAKTTTAATKTTSMSFLLFSKCKCLSESSGSRKWLYGGEFVPEFVTGKQRQKGKTCWRREQWSVDVNRNRTATKGQILGSKQQSPIVKRGQRSGYQKTSVKKKKKTKHQTFPLTRYCVCKTELFTATTLERNKHRVWRCSLYKRMQIINLTSLNKWYLSKKPVPHPQQLPCSRFLNV